MAPRLRLDEQLRVAYWREPDDEQRLRVWADALADRGDPRGEFIQLSLGRRTDAVEAALKRLERRHGGALVGPARPFLRSYSFGDDGLVDLATTEVTRVVTGFSELAALHPRLELRVTSLKKATQPLLTRLAKLPLADIFFLDLASNGLTDAALARLAPALRGVRHLGLAFNDFSGDGLRALATHASRLVFLDLWNATEPLQSSRIDALAERVFPSLKLVALRGGAGPTQAHRRRLSAQGIKVVRERLDGAALAALTRACT